MDGQFFKPKLFTKDIILFVFCLITLSSCRSSMEKDIEKHIIELNNYIYVPNRIDWQIINYFNWDEPRYLIKSINYDTTYEIGYIVPKTPPFYVDYFKKSFFKEGYYYIIEFNSLLDTLYYYRSELENSKRKEFFVGKYLYQANHNLLSIGQLEFYHQNYNSLKNIRGDSLPALPDLRKQ